MEEELKRLIDENHHTRDLFVKALQKLNVPYTAGEDNDRYDICFKYRGETFYADAMNESEWIDIFDPFWYRANLSTPHTREICSELGSVRAEFRKNKSRYFE